MHVHLIVLQVVIFADYIVLITEFCTLTIILTFQLAPNIPSILFLRKG